MSDQVKILAFDGSAVVPESIPVADNARTPRPQATILIVEDSPNDVLLIKRAFSKIHNTDRLSIVSDGQEALDYLFCEGRYRETKPSLPALVLLDLNLPKLNGFEVLQRIRRHQRTWFLPVVILSSSNETSDLVKSYRYGANSYIQKPVEFEQFIAAIRTLRIYWLDHNIIPTALT